MFVMPYLTKFNYRIKYVGNCINILLDFQDILANAGIRAVFSFS